ncbi:hypothetical protein [Chryseolinea lacunae]|uniref:DUF3649 domain-containing protein n=1 Tax=Chryseolinea lacunae TaxID=2801331 RepID=A0ABS1KRX1_9BACT|nr:hypothetical protein [Chryseolinea lacunae]MBL0741427.1 hypothetical protein [Chryseolinea lacunae]
MPANPKHLTASRSQRFAKITAAILGGYMLSMAVHLALASWLNHVNVIITATFTAFILWAVLMVLAFLARNGWKVWGLYILLTALCAVVIYLGKTYNPGFMVVHH